MDRRFLVASGLSVALLMGWYLLQRKYFPQALAPRPETAQVTPPSAAPGNPAGNPSGTPSGDAAHAPAGTPQNPNATGANTPQSGTPAPTPAAARPSEEITPVTRPGFFLAKFSTWGAAPIEFTLDHPQYKITVDGKDRPINMVRRDEAGSPFVTSFSTAPEAGGGGAHSDFDLPADAAWSLLRHSDDEIVYALDAGTMHFEKKWSLPREGYALGLELSVENRGDKALAGQLQLSVAGWQDPRVEQGGILSMGKRVNLTDGECDVAEKVKRVVWKSGGGCTGGSSTPSWSDAITEVGNVRWVGVAEQFFIVAAVLDQTGQEGPAGSGELRTCRVFGDLNGKIVARAVYPSRTFAAGAKQTYSMAAFAGPKKIERLDGVMVAGQKVKIGNAVNYTLEFIARPMQLVLQTLQRVVVNWGVAIILITILLKLIMFYPTQQSMKSAKKMAALKPQIDALKTKFPDDQVKQQQEQMALFKKNGVSPFGGCLPMLLQMPIYFAFYSMLSNAVELYRASFFGPIRDMTAPFWPLSVATGVLMFVQQKTSPNAADPQQQKMMQFMPIMFMVMTLFLPSGLTLYILTNTLLTMLQQWWMNRNDPNKGPDKGPGKGKSKTPPGKPMKVAVRA